MLHVLLGRVEGSTSKRGPASRRSDVESFDHITIAERSQEASRSRSTCGLPVPDLQLGNRKRSSFLQYSWSTRRELESLVYMTVVELPREKL